VSASLFVRMQGLFASGRGSVHQAHHLNLEMSQAQTVTLMGPMWDMITKQAQLVKLTCIGVAQSLAGSYPAVVSGFTKKTSYIQDIYLTCKI